MAANRKIRAMVSRIFLRLGEAEGCSACIGPAGAFAEALLDALIVSPEFSLCYLLDGLSGDDVVPVFCRPVAAAREIVAGSVKPPPSARISAISTSRRRACKSAAARR